MVKLLLTGMNVKPVNNSAAHNHLLHCNYLLYFDNFSILANENKKILLEIKESLLFFFLIGIHSMQG